MFFVDETIKQLITEFNFITSERKNILKSIASFVEARIQHHGVASLVFICTHNSRRSHIAQIWSEIAAAYFEIPGVRSYSGGTEATAFNSSAVRSLQDLLIKIEQKTTTTNPVYSVTYSDSHPSFDVFSKRYDDESNPTTGFAAIMTCTHADENCPIVHGAAVRFSLPFEDPKDFDGTKFESVKYRERSIEIGREMLYIFSQIRKQ